MLIECPECKKTVSDKAVACPDCGYPIASEVGSKPKSEPTSKPHNSETQISDDTKKILEAAEQGDADAQFLLGACYLSGKGVVKDGVKAIEWYEKAAKQGHAVAQESLDILEDSYDEAKSANIARPTRATVPICPLCGGQLERMDAGGRGKAFGSGNLFGAFTHTHRCINCGHLV